MTLERQNLHARVRRMANVLALSACLVPFARAAHAAEPNPTAKPAAKTSAAGRAWLRDGAGASAAPANAQSSGNAVRLSALAVVTALLVGGVVVLKRRRGTARVVKRSDLRVVTGARVGRKAEIVVVQVSGRQLLLGVTEAHVNAIAWLDNDEGEALGIEAREPAALTAALQQDARAVSPAKAASAASPRRFTEVLRTAMTQRGPAGMDAASQIAAVTEDVVTHGNPGSRLAAPAGAPEIVDVEGQARGLVLRLQKRG